LSCFGDAVVLLSAVLLFGIVMLRMKAIVFIFKLITGSAVADAFKR